jgi:taurine dioxygenase
MAPSAPAPTFEALDAPFGVEVHGTDLLSPLDDRTAADLRAALAEHLLLVWRGIDLDGPHQRRLMACFGRLSDETKGGDGWTYVSNDRPDGRIRDGELLFHSDLAFTPAPIHVLSLYAVDVPSDGAPTSFVDTAAALASLPATLRTRVEGLRARHVFDLTDSRGDRAFRLDDLGERAAWAEHPMVLADPTSGRDVLFVSEMQTDLVVDVDPAESEQLLAALRAHLYVAERTYTHRWRNGDLLVWDNIALQHARGAMSDAPRTLRRVPVGGQTVQLKVLPAT